MNSDKSGNKKGGESLSIPDRSIRGQSTEYAIRHLPGSEPYGKIIDKN
jgi:hypothetical protein